MRLSFQEKIPGITCFGCGPSNPKGLQIKSYWNEKGQAICHFTPDGHHNGPPNIVNGGILATLVDCHSVCTAMADAYRREGRDLGEGIPIWYVTGNINVTFRAPTPLGCELELCASVIEATPRKSIVSCTIHANGLKTVEGEVIAVKLRNEQTS